MIHPPLFRYPFPTISPTIAVLPDVVIEGLFFV
jgi:hypothetical protein